MKKSLKFFIFISLFFLCSCSSNRVQVLEEELVAQERSFQDKNNTLQNTINKLIEEIKILKKRDQGKTQKKEETPQKSIKKSLELKDQVEEKIAIDSKYKYNKNKKIEIKAVQKVSKKIPKKSVETKIVVKEGESFKKIYDEGIRLFYKRSYMEAIQVFKHFLSKNPDYDLIDNAHFWIGECFYSIKKYSEAIKEYKIVKENYFNSNKYRYALLKLGTTYLKLGQKDKGLEYLKKIKKYKFDKELQEKLRKIVGKNF